MLCWGDTLSTKSRLDWLLQDRTAAASLALDLSQDAVSLCARDADGSWQTVRRAEIGSESFDSAIDEIRVETIVRTGKPAPIMLWLPEEQVLVRQYLLSGTGADAITEARRRLAAETVYSADELMVALCPAGRDAPTTVLAALAQTVREAEEHAERWGFLPGPVSTRVGAPLTGDATPVFRRPESLGRKAARVSARAVGAGVAVLLAGAVLYTGLNQVSPLFETVEPAMTRGPVFAMVRVVDDQPEAGVTLSTPVEVGRAQALALPRIVRAAYPAARDLAVPGYGQGPATTAPAILSAPKVGRALLVGAAPAPHEPERPGKLAKASAAGGKIDIAAARAGLERIRADAAKAPEADAQNLAAAPPDTATAEPEQVLALAVPSETAQQQRRPKRLRAPEPSEDAATGAPTDPEPDSDAASAFAPVEMASSPRPRPEPPAPQPVAEQTADAPRETAPVEAPATEAPSLVAETAPDPAPALEEKIASIAPIPVPTPEPPPPSVFAALAAPKPKVRPKNVPVFNVQPQRPARINVTPGPKTVRAAASEFGLALDQTSLVGIIDARSGRKALVRLPSGDFRKVARGDDIEGWRVNSISREALRLTRRGQNRTLLLITH